MPGIRSFWRGLPAPVILFLLTGCVRWGFDAESRQHPPSSLGDATGVLQADAGPRATADASSYSPAPAADGGSGSGKAPLGAELLWLRAYGGPEVDVVSSMAQTGGGDLVFGGQLTGPVAIGGAAAPLAGSGFDMAVVRLDDRGEGLWSERNGSGSQRSITTVAVGVDGAVCIAGHFSGVATIGGQTFVSVGETDFYLSCLEPNGEPRWTRTIGGTGADFATDLVVRSDGSVCVAATFAETIRLGGIAAGSYYFYSSVGNQDALLACFDGASGRYRWAEQTGGVGGDFGGALALDSNDALVQVAVFSGPVFLGGKLFSAAGGSDLLVTRYSASGAVSSRSQLGGDGLDFVEDVALSPHSPGELVVVGAFSGSVTYGATRLQSAATERDGFVVRVDSSGRARWGAALGASDFGQLNSVAITPEDDVCVVGSVDYQAAVRCYTAEGLAAPNLQLEGAESSAAWGITSRGRDLFVAGSFSGRVAVLDQSVESAGANDIFVMRFLR